MLRRSAFFFAAAAAPEAGAAAEGGEESTEGKRPPGSMRAMNITRRNAGYRKWELWGYGHEGPNTTSPLQMEAMMHCVDNTNCKHIRLVRETSESGSQRWTAAAVVHRCAAMRYKTDKPPSHHALEPGDLMWCVMFSRRYPNARKSGLVTQFDKNAGILINDKGNPVGTRVSYAAGRHLNHRYLLKAAVLANFLV